VVPNFIKIGQTAAEISHLTIFEMATVCHQGFFNLILTASELWGINMCHRTKFQQYQPNGFGAITIFFIFKMAAVCNLDFEILKILVTHQLGSANMHCHTKFHQNRSNDC